MDEPLLGSGARRRRAPGGAASGGTAAWLAFLSLVALAALGVGIAALVKSSGGDDRSRPRGDIWWIGDSYSDQGNFPSRYFFPSQQFPFLSVDVPNFPVTGSTFRFRMSTLRTESDGLSLAGVLCQEINCELYNFYERGGHAFRPRHPRGAHLYNFAINAATQKDLLSGNLLVDLIEAHNTSASYSAQIDRMNETLTHSNHVLSQHDRCVLSAVGQNDITAIALLRDLSDQGVPLIPSAGDLIQLSVFNAMENVERMLALGCQKLLVQYVDQFFPEAPIGYEIDAAEARGDTAWTKARIQAELIDPWVAAFTPEVSALIASRDDVHISLMPEFVPFVRIQEEAECYGFHMPLNESLADRFWLWNPMEDLLGQVPQTWASQTFWNDADHPTQSVWHLVVHRWFAEWFLPLTPVVTTPSIGVEHARAFAPLGTPPHIEHTQNRLGALSFENPFARVAEVLR